MTIFSFSSHKGEPEETAPNDMVVKKVSPKRNRRRWNNSIKEIPQQHQVTDIRSEHRQLVHASNDSSTSRSPVKVALSEGGSEMDIGYEVSLEWDDDQEDEEQQEEEEPRIPILNLDAQMRKRKRVFRSQFSVNFPALDRVEDEIAKPAADQLRRSHRVPLWDRHEIKQQNPKDVLELLEKYQPKQEVEAIKDEMERLEDEMRALDEDRRDLEKPTTKNINLTKKVTAFDIHEWLSLGESVTPEERRLLEGRRGLCFSFHLYNKKERDALLSAFGCCEQDQQALLEKDAKNGVICVDPETCPEGGKIRHVTLVANNDTGFFLSRDRDKSVTWGGLPPRLQQKMKGAGFDARHDLMYLSTGPQGCYYAEFRSGDCWWGNALKDDRDFTSIVQNWDVYRVAFGPIVTYTDDRGNTWNTNSWVILGRDGRAAWKNLSARFHQKLESRLADWAAPAEVTLGSDDSYFVRYLDGSIDYCLPAEVASVCDYIESRGGRITDMTLHPDVSQDFIIRHTEINR